MGFFKKLSSGIKNIFRRGKPKEKESGSSVERLRRGVVDLEISKRFPKMTFVGFVSNAYMWTKELLGGVSFWSRIVFGTILIFNLLSWLPWFVLFKMLGLGMLCAGVAFVAGLINSSILFFGRRKLVSSFSSSEIEKLDTAEKCFSRISELKGRDTVWGLMRMIKKIDDKIAAVFCVIEHCKNNRTLFSGSPSEEIKNLQRYRWALGELNRLFLEKELRTGLLGAFRAGLVVEEQAMLGSFLEATARGLSISEHIDDSPFLLGDELISDSCDYAAAVQELDQERDDSRCLPELLSDEGSLSWDELEKREKQLVSSLRCLK